MFGGKLRFALSGIWANRRSRGGGRGVEDASGHRRVPKEPALAMMGQGRPGLSLPVQTPVCGLPARSAIWAPPPPTPPPAGLTGSQAPPSPNSHSRRPKGNYTY